MAKELKQEGLQSVSRMIRLNENDAVETVRRFMKSRSLCGATLNDLFEKREQVRKSLENAHDYLVPVVGKMVTDKDKMIADKDKIGRALANLFSMSEIIRETYICADYSVSFDIFHTMRLLGVEHIEGDDLALMCA